MNDMFVKCVFHMCAPKENDSSFFFKHKERKSHVKFNKLDYHTRTQQMWKRIRHCITCHHAEQSEWKVTQIFI